MLIDEKLSEVLEGRVDNFKENYFEMDISLIRFSLTTECMYIFNFTAYFDRVIRNSVLFVTKRKLRYHKLSSVRGLFK